MSCGKCPPKSRLFCLSGAQFSLTLQVASCEERQEGIMGVRALVFWVINVGLNES